MSAAPHLEFDEPGRPTTPLGSDAPSVIADTLRTQGIDAPASLYNEALSLAREGLLGPASQRLQMLICLDPDDADGHLLLSKVYAAQGRPGEALARMEAAIEAGAIAPAGMREQLEGLIRSDRQKDEEHRARVNAREQGEIKALRQEARNLRSETIRLEAEVTETKDRESLWRTAAVIAASVTAMAVIVFSVVTLISGPATPEVAEDTVQVAPPRPPEVPTPADEAAAIMAAPVAPVAPKPAAPKAVAPMAVAPSPAQAVAVPPKAPAGAVAGAGAVAVKLPVSHVVVSGDSLYSLAGKYYGDKMQFAKIRDANKGVLKGGIALKLGMNLTIPK